MLSQRKGHAAKGSKGPRKLEFSYALFCLVLLNPKAQPHKLKAVSTGMQYWAMDHTQKNLSSNNNMALLQQALPAEWANLVYSCSKPSAKIPRASSLFMFCSDSLSTPSKSRQTMFAFGEMLAD